MPLQNYIKNYLWFIPFVAFLLGYLTLHFLFQPKSFKTPTIVGKKLQDAISILSKNQLNLKLIAEKEDSELPHGTILSQKPVSGLSVTPNQSIYVTISKKPDRSICPEFLNRHINEIIEIAKEKNIKHKFYYLPANHPNNLCIAQHPQPSTSMKNKSLVTYICKNDNKPIVFPDFKGKNLTTVLDFLKKHNIKAQVNGHEVKDAENKNLETKNVENKNTDNNDTDKNNSSEKDNTEQNKIIQEQRPLAGSLINLDKSKEMTVHLQVS